MRVTYDLHAHTLLSGCADKTATIPNYVKSAKRLGLETVGIADHMWDTRHIPGAPEWHGTLEGCRKSLETLRQTDLEGVRFLFGGEVEYCKGVGAAISPEEAQKLDFVLAPNSHMNITIGDGYVNSFQFYADYMLQAAMDICNAPAAEWITAIPHPFSPVCCPYQSDFIVNKITDEQFLEVFSAMREKNIAAELNSGEFFNKPDTEIKNGFMFRILTLAKKAGCKFTFGSDSHSDERREQDRIVSCGKAAELLGLTDEDILMI